MAIYRPVCVKMWYDPHFQELTPNEKLVMIYLFTNDAVGESGVYPLSFRTISNDTNIPIDCVVEIVTKSLKRMVSYDADNFVVWVHNFLKYNGKGRSDYIYKSILKDMDNTSTSLWEDFNKCYESLLLQLSNS